MSVYADIGTVLVTFKGALGVLQLRNMGLLWIGQILFYDNYNQDIDKVFWAYIIKEKFANEVKKSLVGPLKQLLKKQYQTLT